MSDFEILLYAGLAIFFGYKLWSVLGKTNGDEAARAAEISSLVEKQKRADAEKKAAKATKPKSGAKLELVKNDNVVAEDEAETIPEHLQDDVEQIRRIDPSFSLKQFITGAEGAFELALEAFSKGNKDALEFLLSKDVYKGFASEVAAREKKDLKASFTLVSLAEPEILDIELNGKKCQIVVKFDSEQINFVENAEGEIVEGSKSDIENIADTWTFERNLASKDNAWKIIGT